MTALLALSLLVGAAAPAGAAERVWDGSARGNGWDDIGNWVGTGVPAAGDSLRFPAGALKPANNNNFPAGTSFNLITYAGAGYTASGNEIGLTGGIVVSHGAGNTVLNLPINVETNQTFTVSLVGANLFLTSTVDLGLDLGRNRSLLTFDGAGQTIVSGNIRGSGLLLGGGAIRKNGSGTLWILQHLTLGGSTTVNGGSLRVDGSLSNSAVIVNTGATLIGSGKVGGLTANSGGMVSPGATSPDILDSLGDVALNAGSTLNIRLNGTTAGINYDQLRVQGDVTLGGTLNVTAGFVAAVGDRFTIIQNNGTNDVIGRFAGLPEGAIFMVNGRPFQISYGARGLGGFGRDVNDVTLEAVPGLSVWDGGGGLNKFWSEPLNWVGDVVPMPGDDVQFAKAGSGTLTTINDFPAGSVFGSMIFAGGDHRVEGNMTECRGNVRMTQPGEVEIHLPLGLSAGIRVSELGIVKLFGAVALRASQTFRVDRTNSFLVFYGDIAADDHDLVVDGVWTVGIDGSLTGTGELIKNGSGYLSLKGTNSLPLTTVNAGTLYAAGTAAGLTVINAGATIDLVSLEGDLEVRGGTLVTHILSKVGNARLLQGSVLRVAIGFDDPVWRNTSLSGYPYGLSGTLELTGCTLDLQLAENPVIAPFTGFGIISFGSVTGTFEGLPSGKRFALGGYVFEIGYSSGSVGLVADPYFVWDGGASGNLWTTAANWAPDFAPLPPGNHLLFPANVSKVAMINDFAPDTSFPSLTFSGPSYLLVGNSFRLTEGIYNDVASGDTTISADFLASGSYFTSRVSSASRLLLDGGVTGNASWRKTGTGTLRLTGAVPNTQSLINVEAGELELDKPSGVNAISTALQIGDGTNDVRVTLLGDHQIADSAGVTIRNRARLDLNGNDEAIGALQGEGTVSLDGRFLPGRSARLTVNSGSFSGAIVGDGGLTKVGPFSLSLSGQSTFSGMTIVSAGTLSVEGTQVNSPIRLDGGILRGRGSVGTITGNLGGTLQPGSGGADFQVVMHSRDVALHAATTFRALLTSIDPGYENHKLQVNGAVNLGGSILSVDLSGTFKPAPGRSFVIIDNDGVDPIVGTFAGLPEGAVFGGDGLPFQITYVGGTGNDVVITRVATPPSTLSSITSLSNRQVRIEGLGIGGVIYPIQAASNLNPIILWTPVGSATGNASGLFLFIDPGASNRPMRFYRAISP